MNTFTLEYFTSKKSSWEFLKETSMPIFIYGMGDGALKILSKFDDFNISCSGIFASDEFVRGHYFEGHKIHKLSEIEEAIDDFIIVLAFAAGYESLIEKVISLSKKHILIAPDVPVIGDGLFTKEYIQQNFEKLETVYNLLEDDYSKLVFLKTIEFKITGEINLLEEITTPPTEAFENILRLKSGETYVDAGTYNGDTVLEFIDQTKGNYEKIYALEPDKRNFKKLSKIAEKIEKIEIFHVAGWSEDTTLIFSDKSGRQSKVAKAGIEIPARSIDSILDGKIASYIKYDVEGAEKQALIGTKETIQVYNPKLMVALYHRNEDIFELPILVKKFNPSYKLFMRHFPYIPAWEINLFAI